MITREEYVELKELRDEYFNWLFSTSDNEIYASQEKPIKGQDIVIYGGKVKKTKIKMFTFIKWEDQEPTLIADLINEYETHRVITNEKVKVTVPQFVADWIRKIKGTYTLKLLFANSDMPSDVEDWLYCNNENCEKMALAWIYGYEIEKEKQYILKFSNGQYLYNCDLGMMNETLGCKLTQAEIESVDPRLMQFAKEVE